MRLQFFVPHRIAPDQLLNRGDQLRTLIIAYVLLKDVLRLREPIAWRRLLGRHDFSRLIHRFGRFKRRQTEAGDMPCHFALLRRAVRAEILQRTIRLCKHLIHPVNHRLTIAPRELGLQHLRVVLRA